MSEKVHSEQQQTKTAKVPPAFQPGNPHGDVVDLSQDPNSNEDERSHDIPQNNSTPTETPFNDVQNPIDSLFHHLYNQRVGDTMFYLTENAKIGQKVREVQRSVKKIEKKQTMDYNNHAVLRKQINDIIVQLNGLSSQVNGISKEVVKTPSNQSADDEIQKRFEMYERIINEQNRTFSEQLNILFYFQEKYSKRIENLEKQLEQSTCK